MDVRILLAIIYTQLLSVAAGATQTRAGEACAVPGALHEEPSGAVRACVARPDGQHAWTLLTRRAVAVATAGEAPDCFGSIREFKCDSTCENSGICVSDTEWYHLQECSNTEVCLQGKCTTGSRDQCDQLASSVQCLDSGNYPDLLDCSAYYECTVTSANSIGNGVLRRCEDTFYDACFQDCGIKTDGECTWKESNGCIVGTYGVARNNDRLYYICTLNTEGKAYPLWRKCETGHFNIDTKKCEREGEVGCGANDCTSYGSSTNPTTSTTTISGDNTFYCSKTGINANPATDCNYYYCFADYTYTVRYCSDGYHFDSESEKCIKGACTKEITKRRPKYAGP